MQVKTGYSDIWNIAYPIIIGSLAQTLLNLIDTAFLARVGEVELGASAVGGVFYFVLVMLGMAIGIGVQIIIARKAGENKVYEIGEYFRQGFLLLFLFSILLFLILQLVSPVLFQFILKNEEVKHAADTFLHYRSYGIFFIMISISFRSFYTGIALTRIITYSSLVMTVVNIILDYLLIYGHYGFPPMGIAGAGLASSIAEITGAIYFVVYTYLKKETRPFELFHLKKERLNHIPEILKISSPIVLQNLISMGAWFLFFVFIEQLGTHELAISNIIRSTYMILMTPIWGFSAAANSMVSNIIGQRKEKEVIPLVKKIASLSFVVTMLVLLITYISPLTVFKFITPDLKLIHDSMSSFHVISVAMIFFSISLILLSAVSGTSQTRVAMFIEIFNITIYLLYVYICSVIIKTSLEVVWASEIIYWLTMGILSYWYLRSRKWITSAI